MGLGTTISSLGMDRVVERTNRGADPVVYRCRRDRDINGDGAVVFPVVAGVRR